MEDKDKKQVEDKRYLILSDKLASGQSLDRAALSSQLSIKQAIEYLKTRKEIRAIEPEILSEIGHRALEVGLNSLIELTETCVIPQVRATCAIELTRMGIKIKEMGLSIETPLPPVGQSGKDKNDPWKFES